MEFVKPRDLPAFLDPLLDYLADRLPGPLYDALFNLLSYGILLLSGALSLIASLPSWKPWEWDAQTILPPLISVLAAYYVLLTMYRTTGWMIRLGIGMVKWTVIVAAVAWFMGSNGANGGGISSFIGELVNGHGNNRNPSGRRGGSGSGAGAANRPRPWDSFNAHRQYQYNENEARDHTDNDDNDDNDVQSVIQQVLVTVSRAFGMFDGPAGGIIQNLAGMATDGAAAGDENRNSNSNSNSNRGGQSTGTRQRTRAQPKRNTKTPAQKQTRSR
jgi:hypothetical protein